MTMASHESAMGASLDSVTYWESIAERRLGSYVTEIERAILEQALAHFPVPGTALEIGCGGGRWAQIPAARGWQLVCTDVDAHSIAMCKQRLPAARCILTSPEQSRLSCASHSVELVVCYEVEPVTESPWFASEVARVLKPGGLLVTTFLNSLSLRSALHKLLRHSSGQMGFYKHGYLSKRKRLRRDGFTLIEEQGCCWIPFARDSDSGWVPLWAALERLAGLRHVPALSPWVVVLAQKSEQAHGWTCTSSSGEPR